MSIATDGYVPQSLLLPQPPFMSGYPSFVLSKLDPIRHQSTSVYHAIETHDKLRNIINVFAIGHRCCLPNCTVLVFDNTVASDICAAYSSVPPYIYIKIQSFIRSSSNISSAVSNFTFYQHGVVSCTLLFNLSSPLMQ